jgi:hypothetical protein
MSNNEKLIVGFKETQEGLTFVFALVNAVEKALVDKQITVGDIPLFLEPLMKFKDAVEDYDQIPVEFKLANAEEAEALKAWVKENFNVEAEKVEELIEDAFSVILDIWLILNKYIVKKENDVPKAENNVPESDSSVN